MERIFGNSSAPNPASWRPEPLERGTYSILSTCIITLGLCVWTAIHLNVPAHRDGSWQQMRRKFGWMMLGLLAPEMVVFTAFQQYTVAKDINEKMGEKPRADAPEAASSDSPEVTPEVTPKDTPGDGQTPAANKGREWSFVHSYFAAMGGFALEIKDSEKSFFPKKGSSTKPPTRLTITGKGLLFLEDRFPGLIPDLPQARIEDKSKASMLAKSLVCFQATWFCVQCISRLAQRLPISLLELNTLGHALCALLIYGMWWEKPLDIEEPELIPVQGEDMERLVAAMCVSSKIEIDPQKPGSDKLEFCYEWDLAKKESRIRRGYFSKRRRTDILTRIPRFFGRLFPRRSVDLTLRIFSSVNPEDVASKAHGLANSTHRIPSGNYLPGISLSYIPEGNRDEENTSESYIFVHHLDLWRWALAIKDNKEAPANSLAERIRNFPRFDQPLKQWRLYLAFGIIGLAYGGLHCLAWDAPFSTDLERIFWRVSSVAVTSTGALIALGFFWAVSPPFWMVGIQAFEWVGEAAFSIFESFFDMLDEMLKARALIVIKWLVGFVYIALVAVTMLLFLALKTVFDLAITAFTIFYTIARVYLVVECFINIAHLPDGAYQVPQWSQYVPHIA